MTNLLSKHGCYSAIQSTDDHLRWAVAVIDIRGNMYTERGSGAYVVFTALQ